jgi:adenosine deaminase
LVEELRRRKIPLEMCLSSNVCTGVVRSVETHPLKRYADAGLQVTINTDDPTMFGCTLTSEYALLLDTLGFTPEGLRKISDNALESSFLDEAEKRQLRMRVHEAWKRAPLGTGTR